MRGSVRITVFEKDEIKQQQQSNKLVYNIHRVLTHLLGQAISENTPSLSGNPADYRISKMKFGTSDRITEVETTDLVAFVPKSVTENFYSLESVIYSDGASTDSDIKFTVFMNTAEGNGSGTVIYNEAGLYTANGIMIARATFSGIQKTPSTSILFEWTIFQA